VGRDFTVHVIARRAQGTHEFDLLSPTHCLSLPLAGVGPRLEGRLDGAQTAFDMQPGRAMLRPALNRFRGLSRGGGTFRYVMFWFDPAIIGLATDGNVDAQAPLPPSADLAHPAILWAMTAMAGHAENPGPGGRLYAESLAVAVLTELMRHRMIGDRAYRVALGRTAPELRRFADYVEAHLDRDLSLFTLSAVAGLSVSHLVRELRRVTGLSPHQYVLRRRAERARFLLERRDRGILDVALDVGFSSQAHLNQVFRRVYGLTPGAYRALHEK
jgi:AraC-like DNA-binding protein